MLGTALLSAYCPGIPVRGRPLPSLGGQSLDYVCNGVAVWWATLAVLAAGQVTGVLPLAVWTGERLRGSQSPGRVDLEFRQNFDRMFRNTPAVHLKDAVTCGYRTGEHFGSILTWSVIFGDGVRRSGR